MPNQRQEGKKLVTFWATEEEKALLQAAATAAGFSTLSDYIKWVGKAGPRPQEKAAPASPRPTSKKRAAKRG